MSWRNWTPPEDIERLESYQRNRTAHSPSAPEEIECSVVRRDGTLMQVLVRVGMIPHTKRSMSPTLRHLARNASSTSSSTLPATLGCPPSRR